MPRRPSVEEDSPATASGFASSKAGRFGCGGYVDYANLYGDGGAKAILAEFWSSDGPAAATWRFDLEAEETDATGHSFVVHFPNDRDGEKSCARSSPTRGRGGRRRSF